MAQHKLIGRKMPGETFIETIQTRKGNKRVTNMQTN